MSYGYAQMIVKGNLTYPPTLNALQDGTPAVRFSVAYSRRVKDKDEGVFVKVTMFGKRAETISKYFTKGNSILVSGRPYLDKYTGKDGIVHSGIAMIADDFDFCDRRPKEDEQAQGQPAQDGDANTQAKPADEDIPF